MVSLCEGLRLPTGEAAQHRIRHEPMRRQPIAQRARTAAMQPQRGRSAEQLLRREKHQRQQARERADRRAGTAARTLGDAGLPKIVAGLKGDEKVAGRGAFVLKAELAKGEAEHGH